MFFEFMLTTRKILNIISQHNGVLLYLVFFIIRKTQKPSKLMSTKNIQHVRTNSKL